MSREPPSIRKMIFMGASVCAVLWTVTEFLLPPGKMRQLAHAPSPRSSTDPGGSPSPEAPEPSPSSPPVRGLRSVQIAPQAPSPAKDAGPAPSRHLIPLEVFAPKGFGPPLQDLAGEFRARVSAGAVLIRLEKTRGPTLPRGDVYLGPAGLPGFEALPGSEVARGGTQGLFAWVLPSTSQEALAQKFVQFLSNDQAHPIWSRHGYRPNPSETQVAGAP